MKTLPSILVVTGATFFCLVSNATEILSQPTHTVDLSRIPPQDVPIYQSLWNLAAAVNEDEEKPIVYTLEMLEDLVAWELETPAPTEGESGMRTVWIMMQVLNPRYQPVRFDSSRLAPGVPQGEVPLGTALDSLVASTEGRFVWRYDEQNGVVNVIESELAECVHWNLNQEIADAPASLAGPMQALNWVNERSSGVPHVRRDAMAWKDLWEQEREIVVEGTTVRECLNSVLGKISEHYTFYIIRPWSGPPQSEEDVDSWFTENPQQWVLFPSMDKSQGYAKFLSDQERLSQDRAR